MFLALASLATHFGRRWIVVTQRKLVERIREGFGRSLSRRTLNRHLAALERAHVINRTQRHQRHRSGKLRMRATLYTFGLVGNLWIKRLAPIGKKTLGRPAVTEMAQSQNRSIYRSKKHAPQGRVNGRSRPPQAGARNGPRA